MFYQIHHCQSYINLSSIQNTYFLDLLIETLFDGELAVDYQNQQHNTDYLFHGIINFYTLKRLREIRFPLFNVIS